MKALIEKAASLGAKVWNEKRVYINGDEMFAQVFSLKQEKSPYAGTFVTIGKARVWFDIKNGTLHSDVGAVRSLLNQNGFACSK